VEEILGIIAIVLIAFVLGAKVGKETTNSDMYHRDYNKCVKTLPRDKDCKAKKIIFEVYDNEK
jgi:hypothetical protein